MKPMNRRLLTPLILSLALLTAWSAAGDRLVHLPRWAQATDDAYVRADLTPLAARVEGHVLTVRVKDHQRVHRGELLVELDPAEYAARVQEAEAHVASARATLQALTPRAVALKATVAAAGAAIEESQAQLEQRTLEAARQQTLAAQQLTTGQDVERATADASRSSAELRRRTAERQKAEAEVAMLGAQVLEAQAQLAAREAQLTEARLQLEYTRIVAPADGVVGERGVHVGQLVRAGAPVITLVELDTVWVTANFKENQLSTLQPGHHVRVTIDTFPGVELLGTVDSFSPASGSQFSALPQDNATGNFTKIVQRVPVKVTLDVPEVLRGRLLPGMSAIVSIEQS